MLKVYFANEDENNPDNYMLYIRCNFGFMRNFVDFYIQLAFNRSY